MDSSDFQDSPEQIDTSFKYYMKELEEQSEQYNQQIRVKLLDIADNTVNYIKSNDKGSFSGKKRSTINSVAMEVINNVIKSIGIARRKTVDDSSLYRQQWRMGRPVVFNYTIYQEFEAALKRAKEIANQILSL